MKFRARINWQIVIIIVLIVVITHNVKTKIAIGRRKALDGDTGK